MTKRKPIDELINIYRYTESESQKAGLDFVYNNLVIYAPIEIIIFTQKEDIFIKLFKVNC